MGCPLSFSLSFIILLSLLYPHTHTCSHGSTDEAQWLQFTFETSSLTLQKLYEMWQEKSRKKNVLKVKTPFWYTQLPWHHSGCWTWSITVRSSLYFLDLHQKNRKDAQTSAVILNHPRNLCCQFSVTSETFPIDVKLYNRNALGFLWVFKVAI